MISCINIVLGVLISLVLYLLDFPNPVLWGVVVAVLNYFPYVGAIVSFGLVTMVSVMTYDSIDLMWQAPLAVLAINSLEGQVVQPLVVGSMFRLNPILVFLTIMGWSWLWGVAGIVFAIPTLMILQILQVEMKNT
jgi:predicted PurR-regulated permease PerM